jgi:hypothetical protein
MFPSDVLLELSAFHGVSKKRLSALVVVRINGSLFNILVILMNHPNCFR